MKWWFEMEIVDPKCPKCGSIKFAYKDVPKIDGIKTSHNQIKDLEKEMKETKDYQDKIKLEKKLVRKKKVFENKLYRPTKSESEALIIFCINCGEIIGTAGGLYYTF